MPDISRRRFLELSGLSGLGVLGSENSWALQTLAPLTDTLHQEYPYRGWESLYRGEADYDSIGYAAHCVNCLGNCAFQIQMKDGIVFREEQLANYTAISDLIPDNNPRGCQKGAVHSTSMYEVDRIRYPMKRLAGRGEGKWQRLSWDQAATEIADKIIDMYEAHGPGKLMAHTGSGCLSSGRMAAGYRFSSILGGVQEDGFTDVGDLNTGAHLAYGDPLQAFTSDAWYEADYVIMSMLNASVTRIPDAHYLWEAKYRGARVIGITPDYNPSAIHADLWLNIKPGTDPYFYMSVIQVIMEENLWKPDYVREQTDLTFLVRADNGKLLRHSDLLDDGSDQQFYLWDLQSGHEVLAPGTMGSATDSIDLGDLEPALEGSYSVNGIDVSPAFEYMRREAMKFSPETTQEVTGLHADIVRAEARKIASAKKLCVIDGFAVGKLLNGLYITWAQALMCALTGHGGPTGGIDTSWLNWGLSSVTRLMTFDGTKIPRFEPGGLGEFLRGGKMQEARVHYDNEKLKAQSGFDLDELQEMIDEAVNSGLMPYHGDLKGGIISGDNKFVRNKGPEYRERMLAQFVDLFVVIDTRMNSTAMYADYILPAASHYEAWDIRQTPAHRYLNFFTAPSHPLGESKPEWDIMVKITEKLQKRARARQIKPYQDGPFVRDLGNAWDDYTMGGVLLTARDELQWLIDNSPELGGQTMEEGAKKGYLTFTEASAPTSSLLKPDRPVAPWERQVTNKESYPTLSGRITLYCDHKWYTQLGSNVPTAKLNAGQSASSYPFTFYTPHTRWGIHTNWRSNKYMMRLQRGEPNVYLNPAVAARKGIADGDAVRVFNSLGEFFAQAKLSPGVRTDTVMMEHAWERYQFKEQLGINNVVATLIQPLEMVGNWGHLKFIPNSWNPNQLANESAVDIEAVSGLENAHAGVDAGRTVR